MIPISYIQSPNLSERKLDTSVDTIIIHHTNMPNLKVAIDRLCDRESEVSAHYVIGITGSIYQLVREEYKAWHAGESSWAGRVAINDCSIGIELENSGDVRFPEVQTDALIYLCKDIMQRHDIKPRYVLGHYDIAPNRKDDPNHYFPWQKLAQNGIGIFPDISINDNGSNKSLFFIGDRNSGIIKIKQQLVQYGYHLDITDEYDEAMNKVVIAFKRHFCPESFYRTRPIDWDELADARINKLMEIINGGRFRF